MRSSYQPLIKARSVLHKGYPNKHHFNLFSFIPVPVDSNLYKNGSLRQLLEANSYVYHPQRT